jgi:hypothetical protein
MINLPDLRLSDAGGTRPLSPWRGARQLHLAPRRFVAEGNFVLVLTEGDLPTGPTALYDLFRVENGKIVEHWDVLTPIPPREQWKNPNGPF